MARNRFDNLEPERREGILAAAGEEFAARGYASASLNRVIERAGISKGSLYYYFDDKEDLFATVVRVSVERMLDELGHLQLEEMTRRTYWGRVREFWLRSWDLLRSDEWHVRLAMAFPRLRDEPEAQRAVRPALEWGRDFVAGMLTHGQEVGAVRRDLPLELLVEATLAVDRAGDRWMLEHGGDLDDEGLARLLEARIDLFRDMLDAENEGWEPTSED